MEFQEFIKRIRKKYPEYDDMDDQTLADSVVKKYPEYSDIVKPVKEKSKSSLFPGYQPVDFSNEEPPPEEEQDEGFIRGFVRKGTVAAIRSIGNVGAWFSIAGTEPTTKRDSRQGWQKGRGYMPPTSTTISEEEAAKITENSKVFQLGEKMMEYSDELMESHPELQDPENMDELGWDTWYKPSVLGRTIGDGVVSILASIGTSAATLFVTKNPVAAMSAGMATTGIFEGGSAYTTARKYDKLSYEEQASVGLLVGTTSTLLSKLPIGRFIQNAGMKNVVQKELAEKIIERGIYKNVGGKLVSQGIAEAVEETSQELAHIMTEIAYMEDADEPTKEAIRARLAGSAYGGFLLGAPIGGATGVFTASDEIDQAKMTVLKESKAGQEIERARKSGDFDDATLGMATNLLKQNPEVFENRSVIEFVNELKEITADQMRADGKTEKQIEEFFSGEGLEGETEAQVTGRTGLKENGQVLVNLYKGADPETVVEEFYGNHYKHLSEDSKKIWKDYFAEYKEEGGKLTEQELFEKEGTEFYFDEDLYKNSTLQQTYRKVKNFFNDMFGRSKLDPKIRKMYEDAGFGKVEEGTPAEGESFQLKPKSLSNQKYATLKGFVEQLTKEGEPARYWYEQSGQALLDITDGDVEQAKKLLSIIAITSPQMDVKTNFGQMVKGYYKAIRGDAPLAGRFPGKMSEKIQKVMDGQEWEGLKTDKFYKNLVAVIEGGTPDVTVDMWMMRAFGIDKDNPTDLEYRKIEKLVQDISENLGWEPYQVQAAIWTATKARWESIYNPLLAKAKKAGIVKSGPKGLVWKNPQAYKNFRKRIFKEMKAVQLDPKQITQAGFDFADAINEYKGRISHEVIPHPTTGVLSGIQNAPYEQQLEYHKAIADILTDENGRDIIAKALNIPEINTFDSPGFYEGESVPSTQTEILYSQSQAYLRKMPVLVRDKDGNPKLDKDGKVIPELDENGKVKKELQLNYVINPETLKSVELYSAIRGLITKQDAIGYTKEFQSPSKKLANSVSIEINKALSDDVVLELTNEIRSRTGVDTGLMATDNGYVTVNFMDSKGESFAGVDNNTFYSTVKEVVNEVLNDVDLEVKLGRYTSLGGLIQNDWSENKNGENYRKRITEGRRSDIAGELVNTLGSEVDQINKHFQEKYGWGKSEEITSEPTQITEEAQPLSTTQQESFRDTKIPPDLSEVSYQLKPKKIIVNKKSKYKPRREPGLWSKAIIPISTRLKKINPKLKKALRDFEYNYLAKIRDDRTKVKPFLEKMYKLSKEDYRKLDLALKNSNTKVVQKIAEDNGFIDEWLEVNKFLEDIHERATEAGLDIGYAKDYFPRRVVDYDGLMAAFDKKTQGLIDAEVEKKQKELNRDLDVDEKADIINSLVLRPKGKGKVGHTKKRTVQEINDEINQYYEHPAPTLTAYIDGMNEAIAMNNFFGKGERTGDSIGDYVAKLIEDGEIKRDQQKEVLDVLRSRFVRQPNAKGVTTLKNVGYMLTMGSPTSAITQIGDLTWALYEGGWLSSAKAMGRAIIGKSKIKKQDIGIKKMAAEFDTLEGTAKWVDTIFKLTGLTKMDAIGKETLINAAIDRYQKQAKRNNPKLKAMLKEVFEGEAGQVLKDLKSGKITENVKMLAFNKLLDFQPAALSEMPQAYLENGKYGYNRLFYQLKTFTIKQLDVFRNEAMGKIFKGKGVERAEGLRNLVQLSVLFGLSNASADALKDWLLGREIHLDDIVIDNLFRLVGGSRFIAYQVRDYGVVEGGLKMVLPPQVGIATKIWRDGTAVKNALFDEEKTLEDAFKNAKSVGFVPWGGKLWYWHFGGGNKKVAENEMKRYNDILKGNRIQEGYKPRSLTQKEIDAYTNYLWLSYEKGWISEATLDRRLDSMYD